MLLNICSMPLPLRGGRTSNENPGRFADEINSVTFICIALLVVGITKLEKYYEIAELIKQKVLLSSKINHIK